MHRKLSPRITLALLFTLGTACAGDDEDDDGATSPTTADDSTGGDDATTASGSPTSATTSPTSATTAPTSDDTDDTDDSDAETTGDATSDAETTGDTGTTGAPDCGPAPESCVALTAREIECDPSLAESEDEILAQCTCFAAGLTRSDACVAALAAYHECVLSVSCDELAEPPCEDGDVLACEP